MDNAIIHKSKVIRQTIENDNNHLSVKILHNKEKSIKKMGVLNKKRFNTKEYNLPDYFDLETIKIINEVYVKDFELLNYELKLSL